METELMMSAADIAAKTGLTPRMINIYRAQAEERVGMRFGRKEGRTTFYTANEVREILKSREAGNSGNTSNSRNFREVVDFSDANTHAESSTLTGMEAIVAASDQNAIALGQAIGERFNSLMWATAMQTMNSCMIAMQRQFQEIHNAVAIPLHEVPQLPIEAPEVARLEGGE